MDAVGWILTRFLAPHTFGLGVIGRTSNNQGWFKNIAPGLGAGGGGSGPGARGPGPRAQGPEPGARGLGPGARARGPGKGIGLTPGEVIPPGGYWLDAGGVWGG